VNLSDVQNLNAMYPPEKILPALKDAEHSAVRISAGSKTFFKPTAIADAAKFKSESPACTIFAGGTDLGVLINKGKIDPTSILSIWSLPNICAVEETATHLILGGGGYAFCA